MEQDQLDLAAYKVQGIRSELISLYDRVPSMKAPRALAVIGGVASVIGLGMFMRQTDPFATNESSRSPYVATTFAVGGTITILASLLILAMRGRKRKEIKKRIALLERDMKLKMSF